MHPGSLSRKVDRLSPCPIGKAAFRAQWNGPVHEELHPEERHRIERLVGGAQMQHIGLAVVDDSEMVLGFRFQRADCEVIVAGRERDQKIRVRPLLYSDGLRVECRNCRGKQDGRISRFEGGRQTVDYEFIQCFLNDFARLYDLDNPARQGENQNPAAAGKQ